LRASRRAALPAVAALAALGLLLVGAAPADHEVDPARSTVRVVHLKAPDRGGRIHEVAIYRPALPDDADLPVLYFLHGYPGAAWDPFRNGLGGFLDRYAAAGHEPFEVAAPDGNGAAHGDTEWADAVDGIDRIESFLLQVVIPAVEGDHRRPRSERAIAGMSMGGYGAMNIALRHPDLFGQVVSVAGYFHVDDPDGMFAGDPGAVAANSPDQHVDAARGLRILLLDGDQEDLDLVRGEARRFAGLLAGQGIPVTVLTGPGHHDWRYVARQYPAITDFLEQGWAAGPPLLPGWRPAA
jgi:S-formylglutathione hydrolase FrmB